MAMPTLTELYEEQARACIELAARLEEPNLCELRLKTARDWMQDAEALRRANARPSATPHADDDAPSDQRAA
jgi:hypothetical protein